MRNWYISLLIALLYNGSFCQATDVIDSSLVNTKVDRIIDNSAQNVKITATITLTNGGKSSVGSFLYAIDPLLSNKLAYISAWVNNHEDNKLEKSSTTIASHLDKQFWKLRLRSKLSVGESTTIVVETIFTRALIPHPAEIIQSEKQYVRFNGNLLYFSPYKTVSQGTKVTLANNNIESYTKTKPYSTAENTISYGPYKDKEPFSESKLQVHSENNSPFLTVTELFRTIEVSHWGMISVEEHLEIQHTGAKLKGAFSRFEYSKSQGGFAAINSFKTVLPSSARSVYYRDEIGNISTSAMKTLVDAVELELRPRFPLFGGWKTSYYLGYYVPSYEYLYNTGDKYVLQMRLVDHIYDDMVVDQMTLKIILPEGSRDLDFKPPFEVTREKDELHFTYLDTVGRPVVVVRKSNLVDTHIQDFQLHYSFRKILLFQEPLMVVGAFFLLFMIVIGYVRLDFSITKDEARESRMRVSSLVEQVQMAHDKRSALYQSYADAVDKFKASKDNASYQARKKAIDSDHKSLTGQIAGLLTKLKSENAEVAEKVTQLQKSDQHFRELVTTTMVLAEKLVSGKMAKNQYLDQEANNEKKKDEVLGKMDDLLASL